MTGGPRDRLIQLLQGRRELFLIQILRDSVLDRGAKRQAPTRICRYCSGEGKFTKTETETELRNNLRDTWGGGDSLLDTETKRQTCINLREGSLSAILRLRNASFLET